MVINIFAEIGNKINNKSIYDSHILQYLSVAVGITCPKNILSYLASQFIMTQSYIL